MPLERSTEGLRPGACAGLEKRSRVLYVGDHLRLQSALEELGEGDGQFSVEALSAPQALSTERALKADLVLIEAAAPGEQALRLAKKFSRANADCLVLLLLAGDALLDSGDREAFLDAGVDAFWPDAGRIEDLLTQVAMLLGQKAAEKHLGRLAAARQRQLDASLDVLCTLDGQGRFLAVSAAAKTVWGYAPEELIGRSSLDFVHPEDHARTLQAAAEILAGTPALSFGNRHLCKDGSIVPMMWSARWSEPDRAIYCAARDITVRKDAERQIDALVSRLTNTLESITDAFFTVDRDWRITYLNREAERLSQKPRDSVFGANFWKEFADAVGGRIYGACVKAMQENQIMEAEEFDASRKCWFHVRACPCPEGLTIRFRDITEQKRDEQLRYLLASIVESSDDAIMSRDLGGRITSWNRGAERVFGYTAQEMVGRTAATLMPPGKAEEDDRITERTNAGESVVHFETKRRRSDGAVIDVLLTASPIRNSEGKVIGASRILRDITERKKLESQFLRAQRMESLGTLAGGIAHDMNNVLGPIVTSLQLLKLEAADSGTRELLDVLEESARRGSDMARQILSFARGVDGDRLSVNLKHLLSEMRRIVSETFPKAIVLKTDCASELPSILGDPTQLHQVLLNLCINARDAMPSGGSLTVLIDEVTLDEHYAAMDPEAKAGRYVLLQVEDTGTGIAAENLDRIFEPFFTTKEAGKGTGLGLATTHAIVKAHSGFIRVDSELGRGTTFKVYLPCESGAAAAEPAAQAAPPVRGNGELILVVDDEPSIRRITGRTLEAFGYRVLLACDGAAALALYATHREEIAAVLTDMVMPVLDGPTTIRALMKMNADVCVIAASGVTGGAEAQRAAEYGVKHFVPKPYTAEMLLKAIHAALHPA